MPLSGEGVVADFDEFFAEHYLRVVNSLSLACGDVSEAEDAAQEGFTRAMLRWRSVSQFERPATWVYVVAVRELRRSLRRRDKRTSHNQTANEESSADPAATVVTAEVVTRTLRQLPDRQRLAVVLRYHGDLTVPEVARAMRCSEGTVKSTLHTALKRLRIEFGDQSLEGVNDGT